MRVLIIGEVPFVDTLAGLCRAKKHHVDLFLAEDLAEQQTLDRMIHAAVRCDVALESLNESREGKQWLVSGVEANLRENALMLVSALASSATECASWTEHAERVVGYGLLPPIMSTGLVEFAPALQSEFEVVARARRFWEELGFGVVRVPDYAGLVRPRMVCTLINAAIRTMLENDMGVEELDTALQTALNYPRGPLSWADEIGLDVVVGVLDALLRDWGEARYHAAPLLRQKVYAGHLGRKAGRGFYSYEGETPVPL